jgi:diguanylate cyclase (GGDEF)-like protein
MHTTKLHAQPATLLVGDDLVTIHALSKALQGMGSLHFAKGGHEALRVARSEPIDLILLDAEMPLMSGFQVCEALKADPDLEHIPVILVTSHVEQDIEQAGLALGAADFISKPIRPVIVAARAATQIRLKRAADELRDLAQSDSLTGLCNRRAFDGTLAREWARSHRQGEPLSVMLVDIDHFKAYNEYHGRRRGDECLVSVTQALTVSLKRPADLAARHGGGSFAVMLPFTTRDGAMEVGRRILRQVASLCIPHGAPSAGPSVTVSIGVSSFDEECDNWVSDGRNTRQSEPIAVSATDLVEAASLALAETKRSGRAAESFVSIYRAVAERMAEQPLG